MADDSKTSYFCARAAQLASETVFGTAVNADIWLLIEVPEPWGVSAVKESSLPDGIKDHLAGLTRTSRRIRVQLIKQESRTKWPRQVFVGFTRQHGSYLVNAQIGSYEDLTGLEAGDLLERKVALPHQRVDGPIFLVCTHGKHDKCCAKFGFATYKFMHAIAPDSVWQTSHVGGDRFASNVISFPTGVYYGHVDDDSAMAIINAERSGEIYLEKYRGRTCFGTHGQVAEYFVRRESGIRAVNALRREWVRPNEDRTRWDGLFTSEDGGKDYMVVFEQYRSDLSALLTCHATEERSPLAYRLLTFSQNAAANGAD